MKYVYISLCFLSLIFLTGCPREDSQEHRDQTAVNSQQAQYSARQPVPIFNFSYERELVRQLYMIRNKKVATHAVWRSDYGMIEGDCPSLGYGIPYSTSLTNPMQTTDMDQTGHRNNNIAVIEQAEPNGLFPSKNNNATWVMCSDGMGGIDPIYVEDKVTVYPYPVKVDYDHNRVYKAGDSTVKLQPKEN